METMKELERAMPVSKEVSAAPEVSVETQPVNQTPEAPVVKEQPKSVDDLIKRVSQVKTEEKKEHTNEFGISAEDYKIVESNPSLSKIYKSLQAGSGKKFSEAAELKRQAEAIKQELSTYTPERVKQMTNDPNFINAAQKVLQEQNPSNSGMSDEEWSTLSPKEKGTLQAMQQELLQLKQQNQIQIQMQQFKHQDETLKTRYGNYNPEAVDIITNDLLTGKVQATREDLWKVYDYENAVNRAYQLGRQDSSVDTQEKINSISIEGMNTQANREVPKAEPKESDKSYFGRIVLNNLSKMKK